MVILNEEGKDFKYVLNDLFLKINMARATKDYEAYYELIEQFECYMYPYMDNETRSELDRLKYSGNGTVMSKEQKDVMIQKFKILMDLAWRKHLIPAGRAVENI